MPNICVQPDTFGSAPQKCCGISGALSQGYLSAPLQSRDASFGANKNFPPFLIVIVIIIVLLLLFLIENVWPEGSLAMGDRVF